MRKWVWLLVLLAVPALHAQVTNPGVRYVATAPSGACTASPPIQVVISTGVPYTCNNGTWASSGGSGSGATLGANTYTGIQSAPGFAGTGTTQTIVNLTQGTTASAPPVNTIQFGAPTSVPTSYDLYFPSAAPTQANSCPAWPNGGGTATWIAPATVLIAETPITVAVSNVTFSSIPQTFKHLRLVYSVSSGAATDSVAVTLNGDTAANYTENLVYNSGSAAGGFQNLSSTACVVGLAGNTGDFASGVIEFANYTSSHGKSGSGSSGSGGQAMTASCRWSGTAAITTIKVFAASTNNLAVDSIVSLYGEN